MVRLHSQKLGILFSSLLRHAWTKLGLFFEAIIRESIAFHCIDFYEPQTGSMAFHEALQCRTSSSRSVNTGIRLNTIVNGVTVTAPISPKQIMVQHLSTKNSYMEIHENLNKKKSLVADTI